MFQRSALFPLVGSRISPLPPVEEKIAKKALDNIIEPFPGYPEIEFKRNFNWTHKQPKLATSYQLYLQNLRVVGSLLATYEHTNDQRYLEKSSEIVNSWLEFVETGGETEMTWYDHAVGSRTRVLMQYIVNAEESGFEIDLPRLEAMLTKHATLLTDDSHHRMNNHGIMMDIALISLGIGLSRYEYVYHGLGRVESIFWQTFSETGMHQENSPEYHAMVQKMYENLEVFLQENNLSLGEDVLRKLEVVKNHLSRVVMPNGCLPPIGDSSATKINLTPDWRSFHDSMSGFSILKDPENESYLAFICGYSATAHKHYDDLSIILNHKKEDFFVDGGKYNYGRNKFRRGVTSWENHSIFSPGCRYTKAPDNRYTQEISTDKFLESQDFSLVSGHNHGFDNAALRRTVYSVPKAGVMVVHDLGISSSKEGEPWNQRFLLSPQAKPELMTDGSIVVTSGDHSISLRWLNCSPTVNIIAGDTDKQRVGPVVSPKTGVAVATKQIVYEHPKSPTFDGVLVIELSGHDYDEILVHETHIDIGYQGLTTYLPRFDVKPRWR